MNGEGTDALIAYAQKELLSISASGSGAGGKELREIVKRSFAEMEERHRTGNALPGLSTGFSGLDTMTGGLKRGCLYVCAGRPGTGKTAIVVQIGRKVAGSGKPVVIFSLEMPSAELSQRLLSAETGIDGHKLTRGYLGADQWRSAAACC